MEKVEDTDRVEPSTPQNSSGFLGKFINSAWNSVKSGVGKASILIEDSAIGKAGKWISKNKVPILNTVGGAAQAFGAITGNPAVAGIGKGMMMAADGIKEGEAKAALQKSIAERQPNPLGSNVAQSHFPRIYYGRKPSGFKIHHKRNKHLERAMAQLAQLKKQISNKNNTTAAKSSKQKNATTQKEKPKEKPKPSPPKKQLSAAEKHHIEAEKLKNDKQFWADLREATRRRREAYEKFEKDDW